MHSCTWTYGGSIDRAHLPASLAVDAPDCDRPSVLRCDGGDCSAERLVACSSTRASRCRPCSKRYRGRVATVARSGRRGGREGLFITLTAPGRRAHTVGGGPADPVCECTGPDGTDLALWNAESAEKWRRITQWLRRTYGRDVEYFRATEPQKRGALHFHVILRRRDGGALVIDVDDLRAAAIRNGFGHEVDVQPMEHVHTRPRKSRAGRRERVGNVYAYVAKYVAKSADARPHIPWSRHVWVTKEVVDGAGRLVTVTDLYESNVATYRTWVASRQWGDTMLSVRCAQAHHATVMRLLDLGDWSWLNDVPWRPDLHLSGPGWSPALRGALVPLAT